ncbi:MAG: DNA-directed RNA polymerase subunit beta', partial [Angelakisella sp.]
AERLCGRFVADDVIDPATGEVLVTRDKMMNDEDAARIIAAKIDRVRIRSIINCQAKDGVCAKCYGANLATDQPVAIGEAVGIIAAQSIGEPGTQLTMRTFHFGGAVSASDITQGLPRVEELFEARKPKNAAVISHCSGLVSFDKDNKGVDIVIVDNPETGEHFEHQVVFGSKVRIKAGETIEKGVFITEGSAEPAEVLIVNGDLAVQDYLIKEVQMVFRTQGVDINDKHIEVIVRQMMKKVKVEDAGDTKMIPGVLIDRSVFYRSNAEIDRLNAEDGGERQKATVRPVLLGITKASLATDSFMSAASFQETTRVLTDAAIKGKTDPLRGLKENVIIGKLIPAGTGLVSYRSKAADTDHDVPDLYFDDIDSDVGESMTNQ